MGAWPIGEIDQQVVRWGAAIAMDILTCMNAMMTCCDRR